MSYGDLARLVTFRPLSMPLDPPTWDGWKSSPFSASWSATVDLLTRELRHLEPESTILEVDLRESDLRIDGLPRANAKAASPGVILTLLKVPVADGRDLRYPCSTFRSWEDNVRGIALSLEALRKVDRYGVTKRGEQYQGWKELPAAGESTRMRGEELIELFGSKRAALMATHPDSRDPAAGYTDADFQAVQAVAA